MPRWAIILIVAPLALCVIGIPVGYLVVRPKVESIVAESREDVSNVMADEVAASVSQIIERSALPDGRLELKATQLNVNNTAAFGEAGIETGTDGTWIYGFVTKMSPSGIALVLDEEVAYSAVPVVLNGRIELTKVEATNDLMRFFLSKDGFEIGMEAGINDALAAHNLTPVAISLGNGGMTILTEPCAEDVGGCPTPMPASERDVVRVVKELGVGRS